VTRVPTLAPTPLRAFGLANVSLRLGGADSAQLARAGALLSDLFALDAHTDQDMDKGTVQDSVGLRFRPSPFPESAGDEIYRAGALAVTRVSDTFHLRCGLSQLHVTPGAAKASCFLAPDFFDHSPFEQREFFLLSLLMLLRPRGLYGLHACGLEHSGLGNDRRVGLLIAGASGSGKTTTSLNLIRRGWRYLSDDAVLLETLTGGPVRAVALRRGFSCTPETLAHFPELTGDAEFGSFGDPDGKRVVYPGDAFGDFTPVCVPTLVVFPTVTAASRTTLHPLKAAHSLIRLSQQSAGIMTDTAVSQRQLGVLKALTDQARSFELRLGGDALLSPDRIDTLLSDAILSDAILEEVSPCVSSSN